MSEKEQKITIRRNPAGLTIDIHMEIAFPDEAGDVVAKLVHCMAQGASKVVPDLTPEEATGEILHAMANSIERGIDYQVIRGKVN